MPVLRKNQNRFRKVYPGIRKKAVFDTAAQIEAGKIIISGTNTGEYTFKKVFPSVPSVTVSIYDNGSPTTQSASVSIVIYDLTTTGFKVKCSDDITAEVFIQAIEVTT
tara:strand:+ start:2331 stop:2654 length:324 start_codon:yes stop_codon:yes gene_type:complete